MVEKTKKDVEAEKGESELLDDDEMETITGGNLPYGNAPDGTPWKP